MSSLSMAGDTPRRNASKRANDGRESNADTPTRKPRDSPKGDAAASTPSSVAQALGIGPDHVQQTPANEPNTDIPGGSETLTGRLRMYGVLKCAQCAKEMTSTASYYLHLKWCGRETETTVCVGCGKAKKTMWMRHHKRICKAYKRRRKPANAEAAATAAAVQPSVSTSQALSTSDSESRNATNTAENSNEHKTCLVCQTVLVNLDALKVHYMEHHTRVWSDRVPLGCDNAEALDYILKTLGNLKCQKCQRRLKSVRYYRFHFKWCGRKNEVQPCTLCNTMQPAILLRRHQKVCQFAFFGKRRSRSSTSVKISDTELVEEAESPSTEHRGQQSRPGDNQADSAGNQLASLPLTVHPAEQSVSEQSYPSEQSISDESRPSEQSMSDQSLVLPSCTNEDEESRDGIMQPTASTPADLLRVSSLTTGNDRAHGFSSDSRLSADRAADKMHDAVTSVMVSNESIPARSSEFGAIITWDDVMGGMRTNPVQAAAAQCYTASASLLPLATMLEINKLMATHGMFTYYLLNGGMLVLHPESNQNMRQFDALLNVIQQVLAKHKTYVDVIPKYGSFNATLCGNGIGATVRVGGHCQTVGLYVRHKGVAYFVTAGHRASEVDNDGRAGDVPVCMSSHADVPGITPGREEVRLAGQFHCFRYDPLPNAAGERMLNHVDIMICPMPSFYTELGSLRRGLDLSAACYTCRTCHRHSCACGVPPDVAYSVGSIKFFEGKETVKCCEGVVCVLRAEELVGEVLMCCPRDQQVVAGEVLSYGNAIAIRTANGRMAVMNNVLLIKSLGRVPPAKGDSGSVWVNPKTGEAVAITCAMGEAVDVDCETTVSVWLATLLHACLDALCYAHKPTFNRVGEFKALAAAM